MALFGVLAAGRAAALDFSAHATGFARSSTRADLPYDREVGWGADLGGPMRTAWSFARGRRAGRSYTNQRLDAGIAARHVETLMAWRDLRERDLWTFGATVAWRRGGKRLSWSAGVTQQWAGAGFADPATLLHVGARHASSLAIASFANLERKIVGTLDMGNDRSAVNAAAELVVQVWRLTFGAVGVYDELRRDRMPTLRVFGATLLSRMRLI